MRDRLVHRGPDGKGLQRLGSAIFGHTRLAVIDTSDAGAQPMRSPCGSKLLVYNGELYNDLELRRELASMGVRFTGHCDAETVLHTLDRFGIAGLHRLRGMFALAWYDAQAQELVLARDPLGVKPLYWWTSGSELAFASEIPALLRHPAIPVEPDLRTISAYLTTIRTTCGDHTLFEGVRTLEPGAVLRFDLANSPLRPSVGTLWSRAGEPLDESAGVDLLREAMRDSVARHLRSDVPACVLLSGGLDSTILAALSRELGGPGESYCAGVLDGSSESPDFAFAHRVAGELGLSHTEVAVNEARFQQRWGELVERLGVPLSTPNEVAIHEVARRLRRDGHIVAISGEGADELFAGYELPMRRLFEHVESGNAEPWLAQVDQNAWIGRGAKRAVLRGKVADSLDDDALLVDSARRAWHDAVAQQPDSGPLAQHLAMQRRTNLDNLLRRLDTATMLAGVEGRTPFADVAVAQLADRLPITSKFSALTPAAVGSDGPAEMVVETKRILRRAFEGIVPREVIERPKASFPLPFQAWMGAQAPRLRTSAFAGELFTEAARLHVAQQPDTMWHLAWPMLNLTIWGDALWG